MSKVTRILSAVEQGDLSAASQLLPLVYHELRQLAAQRLVHEKLGQTLQATALVHEAYLRLVDVKQAQRWDSRGHFFAAAEAMGRILVAKGNKQGGGRRVLLPRPVRPQQQRAVHQEARPRHDPQRRLTEPRQTAPGAFRRQPHRVE